MDTPPPSLWLLSLLAAGYLSQTVRLGRLSLHTNRQVGSGWLNGFTYLFFIPIALAALNPKAFPAIEPLILWLRSHFLAVVVSLLIASEAFLHGAVSSTIGRLIDTVETSREPERVQQAADALDVLGLFDMAIVGVKRVVALTPESSRAYTHLASLYGIQRRFLRAEEAARRAVELDQENKFAHYYLGMAAHELGRHDEAAERFRRARELGLDMPDALFPSTPANTEEPQ